MVYKPAIIYMKRCKSETCRPIQVKVINNEKKKLIIAMFGFHYNPGVGNDTNSTKSSILFKMKNLNT